jgi:hypothetical protein
VEASSEAAENYIDLKGFSYTPETKVLSASFDSTTDVTSVTVTNGDSSNDLTIALVGNYHSKNFEFSDDGDGGTFLSDPAAKSVVSSASNSSLVPTAPTQTPNTLSSSDNFAFNFAGVHHAEMMDFHTFSDTLSFSSSTFTSAQAALSAARDGGHGNTFNAVYGHDGIISDVQKVLLHVGDFHVF